MTLYDIEVAADLAQEYNELSESWVEGEEKPAPEVQEESQDNEPF